MIMEALFHNIYYDHRLLIILEWHRNSVLLIIRFVELITNEKGGEKHESAKRSNKILNTNKNNGLFMQTMRLYS